MVAPVFVAFIVLLIFILIYVLLPNTILSIVSGVIALLACLFFLFRVRGQVKYGRRTQKLTLTFSWLIFLSIPFIFFFLVLSIAPLSIKTIYWAVAITGVTFTVFYDSLHLPLAIYHKYKEPKNVIGDYTPEVSFLVPAYNEEKCIARTLISLLEIDYPKMKIIVIDDGSTDSTYEIAKQYENKGVTVIKQPNRGKSVAINTALLYTKSKIIITVDADSLIEYSGIWSVIGRFRDPAVMAVCGNVKVLNRNNLITRCQALEYIMDINLAKRAFDLFGSTMVVPGVFGAFRRDVLERSGRYDIDTITEDFDVTIKALKSGGVVQATAFAVSYTEAPETIGDLYKQRLRWYRGTTQTFLKHIDVLKNPRFGLLSELGFPYIMLSMVFVPLSGLSAFIAGIFAITSGQYIQLIILLLLFILVEVLLALFSILLDDEDPKLILYAPLFVVGYRQWRDIVKAKAMFDTFFHKEFNWDKVKRLGSAEKISQKH